MLYPSKSIYPSNSIYPSMIFGFDFGPITNYNGIKISRKNSISSKPFKNRLSPSQIRGNKIT